MRHDPEQQLIRLASDNTAIYQDAREWFFDQGPSIVPVLVEGLERSDLGSVAHWRILLLLREFALPSTLPAILKAFRRALDTRNFIVLPGAMEALAVFKNDEALSALISVLQSGEIDDVKHAVALLGEWGSDRAAEALIVLLDHPEAGVRKSAVKALSRNTTASVEEALKHHGDREKDPDVLAEMSSKPEDDDG
jgi:HEAT repeat protein